MRNLETGLYYTCPPRKKWKVETDYDIVEHIQVETYNTAEETLQGKDRTEGQKGVTFCSLVARSITDPLRPKDAVKPHQIMTKILDSSSTTVLPRLVLMQESINPTSKAENKHGLINATEKMDATTSEPKVLLNSMIEYLDDSRMSDPRVLAGVSGYRNGWYHVMLIIAYRNHAAEQGWTTIEYQTR